MDEKNCIFCQILAGQGESSLVYHDALCTVFLDIQPVNPGHLLVIPNRHATYLADLREEEGAQMFHICMRSVTPTATP